MATHRRWCHRPQRAGQHHAGDDGERVGGTDLQRAVQGLPPIAGLTPDDVRVVNGGLLAIGGEEGLGFAVTGILAWK